MSSPEARERRATPPAGSRCRRRRCRTTPMRRATAWRGAPVLEQAWAGAEGERVDEEVKPVDEAVGDHRPHERDAAADVEVAGRFLQLADRVGVVGADDLRIPPGRVLERPRDDVLRRLVEERRSRVVLDRPRRPCRLEHLIRLAAEQDSLATAGHLGEQLGHLGVEAVVERPGRRLDDAVEAHELVYVDRSHRPNIPLRARGQTSARRERLEARVPRAGGIDVEAALLHLAAQALEELAGVVERRLVLVLAAVVEPPEEVELAVGDPEVDLAVDARDPVEEPGAEQLAQRGRVVVASGRWRGSAC